MSIMLKHLGFLSQLRLEVTLDRAPEHIVPSCTGVHVFGLWEEAGEHRNDERETAVTRPLTYDFQNVASLSLKPF